VNFTRPSPEYAETRTYIDGVATSITRYTDAPGVFVSCSLSDLVAETGCDRALTRKGNACYYTDHPRRRTVMVEYPFSLPGADWAREAELRANLKDLIEGYE
jgi:hypothetical protein